MVKAGTARVHSTFHGVDPQAMAAKAYVYSKLLPEDPYRDSVVPKPKPRPRR